MKKHDYIRIITAAALVIIAAAALVFTVSYVSAAGGGERGTASESAAAGAAAPVPGGPGFVSLGAFAFTGWPTDLEYHYSGVRLMNSDVSAHFYEASVQLPHGVTITKFLVFYYDNSATYNFTASLLRASLDQEYGTGIAGMSSYDSSASVRYMESTTISYPVVDNQSYQYFIQLEMPPTLDVGLVSVRIDYQYSSALPRVVK